MFTLYENDKLLGEVSNWSVVIPPGQSKPIRCQFSIAQMVNMSASHSIYFEGSFRWNIKITGAARGIYVADIL